jgi:hypothetical protein
VLPAALSALVEFVEEHKEEWRSAKKAATPSIVATARL